MYFHIDVCVSECFEMQHIPTPTIHTHTRSGNADTHRNYPCFFRLWFESLYNLFTSSHHFISIFSSLHHLAITESFVSNGVKYDFTFCDELRLKEKSSPAFQVLVNIIRVQRISWDFSLSSVTYFIFYFFFTSSEIRYNLISFNWLKFKYTYTRTCTMHKYKIIFEWNVRNVNGFVRVLHITTSYHCTNATVHWWISKVVKCVSNVVTNQPNDHTIYIQPLCRGQCVFSRHQSSGFSQKRSKWNAQQTIWLEWSKKKKKK